MCIDDGEIVRQTQGSARGIGAGDNGRGVDGFNPAPVFVLESAEDAIGTVGLEAQNGAAGAGVDDDRGSEKREFGAPRFFVGGGGPAHPAADETRC